MSTTDLDPAKAHTLSEFLYSMAMSQIISYHKLSFIEVDNGIEYTVKNVLEDYLYELKQKALTVTLDTAQQLKYHYNPKMLAYDVYESTELYYVILALNDICNVKEFNTNPIKMLTKDDMNELIPIIYNANSAAISTYNSLHT